MKQRQQWLKGLSIMMITATVGLTGCSTGSQQAQSSTQPQPTAKTTTAAPASDKAVKLKIMWWGTQARHDATLKALDLYTSQVPKVTFAPEYTAWDGFWEKLPTLAASNTIPDVLQMDAAYIQSYVKRGQLADLSDLDLKDIVDPKILENVKINGKLYGVPLTLNGQGIVYNKPELEAAGIKLPFNNWSYDDFFAFAKEARTKLPKDKYPIDDLTNVWDWYQYYQTAQGKGPIFQDGTKFNLDKDTWFQFQNIYAGFRKDGIVPSADLQMSFKENDPKLDSMASGKVLLRGASVGSATAVEALVPGKLAVNSYPIGSKGGGWAQSTIFLSVGANSANKEQAKQFIKWFISNQEAGKTLGTTRGIPINEAIFKSIESTLSKGDLFGKDLLNVAKDKALPFYPAPPGSEDFVKTYKSEMEAVMFGKQTLEQAFKTITDKGKDAEAKLNK